MSQEYCALRIELKNIDVNTEEKILTYCI